MEQKSGVQISRKAFIQSFVILLVLMVLAGILTQVIPGGSFSRSLQNGREIIVPDSYSSSSKPEYPIWRWFLAPFETLAGPDGLNIIVIVLFILLVGGSFAVLDKCGILNAVLSKIVKVFGSKKYLLLLIISFLFMAMGAFFGIFEEVVPLIPLMIALAVYMGWDTLVGLGMSILATNMGFSAALSNPFTIGVAQKLAGLPLFSGFLFRIPIFLIIYTLQAVFLVTYAKKIEKVPSKSLIKEEKDSKKVTSFSIKRNSKNSQLTGATIWFVIFLVLIVVALICTQFVQFISDFALPLVGLLIFIGGLGAGFLSKMKSFIVWKALSQGLIGILPGVPLILMAASIKYIVVTGGIMDTVLFKATNLLSGTTPVFSSFLIFAIALVLEIFISSGSAKAFLLIPILIPLADLVGISHQTTVLAYCFGDGFSNMAYPTSAVLLISLGLANVSYGKWIRWTWKIWLATLPVVLLFLWLAVRVNLGPF